MLRRSVLLAVFLVTACGTQALSAKAPVTSSGRSPQPTQPTQPTEVTAADNGRTIALRPGGVLHIKLHSGELWSVPAASNALVLGRTAGGVDAATGDATATFSATTAGHSAITSDRRCLPHPGLACAMYIAQWGITVVVG